MLPGTYRLARFNSILVWLIASALPIGPYTIPLFEQSLSDTPQAYLAWIAVLAFVWSIWNLNRQSTLPRTHQATYLGLTLLVASGLWLTLGKVYWPVFFFRSDAALLAWPVWSLGLAWVLFGISASKSLLRPLTYLFLVWPPIYEGILTVVNPPLESLAVSSMSAFSSSVSWMRPDSVFGVFDVTTAKVTVPVFVSQACSGSDSVLALLILFPITLIFFRIPLPRQVLLIIFGSLLAFAANLLRIFLIILALHIFGYSFAFNVLHPILGAVMFFALVLILLLYGTRQQLTKPQTAATVESVHTLRSVGPLLAVSVAIMQTALLAPLYFWATGSALRPVTLASEVRASQIRRTAASAGDLKTVVDWSGSVPALYTSRALAKGAVRSVRRVTVLPGIYGRTFVTNGACLPGAGSSFCVDTVVLLHAVKDYKARYIRVDVLTSGQSSADSLHNLAAVRTLVQILVTSLQRAQSKH